MSNPSDFCIGCMNDEYPEGLRNEIESMSQQLAETRDSSRSVADYNLELIKQLAESRARVKQLEEQLKGTK